MKKIVTSLVLTSLLAVPALVLAQEIPEGLPAVPGWQTVNVWETLYVVVDYVFWGLIILATIFIMIAGYNFITAAGDPDKTKTARNFVLYALIGVLVGFLAKGLIYFVGQMVV